MKIYVLLFSVVLSTLNLFAQDVYIIPLGYDPIILEYKKGYSYENFDEISKHFVNESELPLKVAAKYFNLEEFQNLTIFSTNSTIPIGKATIDKVYYEEDGLWSEVFVPTFKYPGKTDDDSNNEAVYYLVNDNTMKFHQSDFSIIENYDENFFDKLNKKYFSDNGSEFSSYKVNGDIYTIGSSFNEENSESISLLLKTNAKGTSKILEFKDFESIRSLYPIPFKINNNPAFIFHIGMMDGGYLLPAIFKNNKYVLMN